MRLLLAIIGITTILYGCRNNTKPIAISWKKVHKMGLNPMYSYAEKLKNGDILFAYSNSPASGGSYRILKQHKALKDYTVLKYSAYRTTDFISRNRDAYYCIETNFDKNTLQSILLSLNDSTDYEIHTPVTYPRSFYALSNNWITEGTRDGMGYIYQSNDSGKTWQAINYINKYYAVSLLKPVNDSVILCLAQKDRAYQKQAIVSLNTKNNTFTDVHDIGIGKYITPICGNQNTYCYAVKNVIKFFELTPAYKETTSVVVPSEIDEVENIYSNKSILIVTGESYKLGTKIKSWISYNGGESWQAFMQEKEYQLLYNPNGLLLMYDNAHIVLQGEYKP